MSDTPAVPDAQNVTEPQGSEAEVARRWIAEIELAEKARKPWLDRCQRIAERYTASKTSDSTDRRFAMLWANVQTLQPAIYARTPKAVCSRRFKDGDPVGRHASEVLERASNVMLETGAFDLVMRAARDEFLLFGLGQAWVRYVPTFGPAEKPDGDAPQGDEPDPKPAEQVSDQPDEVVEWEEVETDHVAYNDFLTNPARTWQEVRWVARRVYLARDEVIDRFGEEIGKTVPLDWKAPGSESDPSKADYLSKAIIWEVWCLADRKVYWVCAGYPHAPLDTKDDPLKLRAFFPCPRPLLATTGPDSLIPTPDFVYYQDQAEEIDDLTGRIRELTKALKVVGVYDASQGATIINMLSKKDGDLIPVETYSALGDKGGVKGLVDWFPVEMVANVLKELVGQRKQLVDDVYQLTGISDIMRGDTEASETAAAQRLKSQWGSSRVRDRQQEMARFARDLVRLQAEVIAQQFDAPTLAKMTDVQLPTAQEKAQAQAQFVLAQQQAAQPPQPGMQPPPPPQPSPILALPAWEGVESLLRDDATRTFRVDIEVDSTVEADQQQEKAQAIEFAEAFGKLIAESVPLVQATPAMAPLVAEVAKFVARRFPVARELEDTIESTFAKLEGMPAQQPEQKPQADPQAEQAKAQAASTSAQASMVTAQARLQDSRTAQFEAASKHQIGMAQVQAEDRRTAADVHMAAQDNIHDVVQQADQRAQERDLQHLMTPGPLVPPPHPGAH